MSEVGDTSGMSDTESEPPAARDAAPIDQATFRTVLGNFASGVVVLSAMTSDGPTGMSCQSFFSVSLDPPLVAISPSRTSTTWPRLHRAGHFCVSVLTAGQQDLCHAFAVSGGDKFAGVNWFPGKRTGAPIIDGALAWIECAIRDIHDAGDHYLVLGQVLDLGSATGEPLMFYRGGFGSFRSLSPAG